MGWQQHYRPIFSTHYYPSCNINEPLYLRTLWHYTNAVIIIIIIIIIIWYLADVLLICLFLCTMLALMSLVQIS